MTPYGQYAIANLLRLGLMGSIAIAFFGLATGSSTIAQSVPTYTAPAIYPNVDVERLAKQTTVRILAPNISGSGVIVDRQGQTYTVLTNWHVVATDGLTIITPDGRRYAPITRQARQLGNADLAVTQFRSTLTYAVAPINSRPLSVGERLFAAGFPMYESSRFTTTFDRGINAFRLTNGEVLLLPPKSLAQGYRLGYTNDIAVGMSGGPIFNGSGLLVGINGRVKSRDPGFGVYAFDDGTEPSPGLLAQMETASWGIPISTYLQTSPPTLLLRREINQISSPTLPLRGEGRRNSPVFIPVEKPIIQEKRTGEVRSTLSQ